MNDTPQIYLDWLRAVGTGDTASVPGLWEPDGVLEFPYAVSVGTPTELHGADAIVDYLVNLDLFDTFTISDLQSWPTGSPSEWLAEFHGSSHLSTGAPYEQDYIVRFTVSARGRLAWMREYWDPMRFTAS